MKRLCALLFLSLSFLAFGCSDHDHDGTPHVCEHLNQVILDGGKMVTLQAGATGESPAILNQHIFYEVNLSADESGYFGYVAVVIDEASDLAFFTPHSAVLTDVDKGTQLKSEAMNACPLYEHEAHADAVGTMVFKITASKSSIYLLLEKEDDHDH